jgi:hypothetical protein
MPFEVWNIEQERIGGLQLNPPDDPHEWFTVGLYGTDADKPALGFQLHDSSERPPDGDHPGGSRGHGAPAAGRRRPDTHPQRVQPRPAAPAGVPQRGRPSRRAGGAPALARHHQPAGDPAGEPADAQDDEDLGLDLVDRIHCQPERLLVELAVLERVTADPLLTPALAELGRLLRRWADDPFLELTIHLADPEAPRSRRRNG